MDRHTVPQNLLDVEFKLFGALTIKQFAYLAGGFVGALLFYLSDLPFVLKLVLIIASAILGLFLSLVKINGQPSSTWLSNFVLALFTSQQRVWKKTPATPEILQEAAVTIKPNSLEEISQIEEQAKAAKLPVKHSKSIIFDDQVSSSIDKLEDETLIQIDQHFNNAFQEIKSVTPTKKVEVVQPQTPKKIVPAVNTSPIINTQNSNLAGKSIQQSTDVIYSAKKIATPFTAVQSTINRPLGAMDKNKEINKTESNNVQSIQENKSQVQPEENLMLNEDTSDMQGILRGKVVDKGTQAIEKAVVLIKDANQQILRKITSDSKGMVVLATPLPLGEYFIDIEHDKYKFPRFEVTLHANNEIYLFKAK